MGLTFLKPARKNQRGFHHGPGGLFKICAWIMVDGAGVWESGVVYACLCENEIWMPWMCLGCLWLRYFASSIFMMYDKS